MLMDVHQLSRELNVSESGIYQWINQRRIPFIRIGRAIRFESDEIKKWLAGKRVEVQDFD